MTPPLIERTIPATAADLLDPRTCALLLWDLQVGLGGQALHLPDLIKRWNDLRSAAQRAGVLVVRSRHIAPRPELMNDAELWRIARKQKVTQVSELAPYMQLGSTDVEFIEGFRPSETELVIQKATPSIFVGTAADSNLRTAGIKTLVMAGVATDIGIEFTGRHAQALGYYPVVVEDAVGAYTVEAQTRGLACLRSFALMTSTAEVTQHWL